jgi:hypothetical protein
MLCTPVRSAAIKAHNFLSMGVRGPNCHAEDGDVSPKFFS